MGYQTDDQRKAMFARMKGGGGGGWTSSGTSGGGGGGGYSIITTVQWVFSFGIRVLRTTSIQIKTPGRAPGTAPTTNHGIGKPERQGRVLPIGVLTPFGSGVTSGGQLPQIYSKNITIPLLRPQGMLEFPSFNNWKAAVHQVFGDNWENLNHGTRISGQDFAHDPRYGPDQWTLEGMSRDMGKLVGAGVTPSDRSSTSYYTFLVNKQKKEAEKRAKTK